MRVQEIGGGPVALFVHGASTAGPSWAPLVARLADFRCVVLDRPGCGLSDPLPAPFTTIQQLETFADVLLVDVLDALGVNDARVVATSFGGYLSFRAAAAHPDRIGRLVEIGWTVGAPISRVPLPMRIAAIPGLRRVSTAVPPTRRAVMMMLRQIGLRHALATGRVSDEMIDWFLALLRDTATMRNELQAGPNIVRPIKGMDDRLLLSADLLKHIKVPIGVVWGEDDIYGGAATARSFVAQLPNAVLETLPAAGHAAWLDDPDRVAQFTHHLLRH